MKVRAWGRGRWELRGAAITVAAVALTLAAPGCDKVKELMGTQGAPSPAPTTEAPAAPAAAPTAPDTPKAPTTAPATKTGAPAGTAPTPGPDPALRSKLKALAVASQCMQKAGKTSEEMAETMFAQYKAFGVSLEDYTREMGRLAGDQAFQAEVRAAVASCPGPAPKVAAVDSGAAPAPAGGAKPAEPKPAEPKPADAKPADAKPADTRPAEPKPAKPKPAETKPAETKPAETKPAEPKPAKPKPAETKPAEPKPAKPKPADATKPKPKLGGTFKGSVSGSARGSITVRVSGSKASGSAVLGATRIQLRGRFSGGTVRLQGRAGNDYARFTGRMKGKRLSGSWQGTVARRRGEPSKRSSGSWSAGRR